MSDNPIARAASIMNQNLSMEQRFPALDDYVIRKWNVQGSLFYRR
jgi:hypothetical protein